MRVDQCKAELEKLANAAGSADKTDAYRHAATLVSKIEVEKAEPTKKLAAKTKKAF